MENLERLTRIKSKFCCQWSDQLFNDSDGPEWQDWKNLNSGSYRLFKEGNVQSLSAGLSSKICCVKGNCLPEMKRDHMYELQMCLSTDNSSVKGVECTCTAGQGPIGSCKHIAAFCFALEDFVTTRD